MIGGSVVFLVFSLTLFLAEETIYFQKEYFLDLLKLFNRDGKVQAQKVLFFVSILLSYMIYVVLIGVFYIKVFGYYEFYLKNTTASTLLNAAFYISKFVPPICFNVMTLVFGSNSLLKETAFFSVALASTRASVTSASFRWSASTCPRCSPLC